jgi:hypothetical protein
MVPGTISTRNHFSWERQRLRILEKNNFGVSPNDAGPLWLGIRLLSARSQEGYQGVTYSKGAYVLLMLRSLMYADQGSGDQDQTFIDMMHDFVESHRDSPASTETFKAIAEKHMPKLLDIQGKGTWIGSSANGYMAPRCRAISSNMKCNRPAKANSECARKSRRAKWTTILRCSFRSSPISATAWCG